MLCHFFVLSTVLSGQVRTRSTILVVIPMALISPNRLQSLVYTLNFNPVLQRGDLVLTV